MSLTVGILAGLAGALAVALVASLSVLRVFVTRAEKDASLIRALRGSHDELQNTVMVLLRAPDPVQAAERLVDGRVH